MAHLTIRQGRAAEISALQDIEVRSGVLFNDVGMSDIADAPPADTETFKQAAQAGLLLVAESAGSLAGFALLLNHDNACHLQQLSVDPAFMRQGIGSRLVQAAEKTAAERGFARMTLSTFSELAWNRPFYETLGYMVIPRTDYTEPLHACRDAEAEAGLDVDSRVMMGKLL